MVGEIQGEVMLTFVVEKDGELYASRCVELGTVSCGDSTTEALTNIQEAVTVHLNALEEVNERARLFAEKGITLLPVTAGEVIPEETSVRVPVYA